MRIEVNQLKNESQINKDLNEDQLVEKVNYLMKQLNDLKAAKEEEHNSKIQENDSVIEN